MLEVSIGGRDDPDVDLCRPAAAHGLELVFLQHAEQLDLHVERQLTDFVEEQRAAIGQFEASDPAIERAGERTSDMSEQLALDQPCRDRAAVDFHERMLVTRAAAVDGARHQFLAGAGFAEDQDRRVGRRDAIDRAQRRQESGAVADNLLEIVFVGNLFSQIDVLAFELRLQPADFFVLAHVFDRERQLVRDFPQQLRLGRAILHRLARCRDSASRCSCRARRAARPPASGTLHAAARLHPRYCRSFARSGRKNTR